MGKRLKKTGGGIFGTVANGALWYEAAQNSDGTFWGTVWLRLKYGFYILLIPVTIIGLFFLFAKRTHVNQEEKFKDSRKTNS